MEFRNELQEKVTRFVRSLKVREEKRPVRFKAEITNMMDRKDSGVIINDEGKGMNSIKEELRSSPVAMCRLRM